MNFHALLRVDSSKRKAEQYRELEKEILRMIDLVTNNRNFILDQKIMQPNPKKPELNLYMGSDFGFCGSINSAITALLEKDDPKNYTMVIGKKLSHCKNIDRIYYRDEVESDESIFLEIKKEFEQAILKRNFSKINLIYSHYYNSSDIRAEKKCIYPLHNDLVSTKKYSGDYAVEGEAESILIQMLVTYLSYEVQIAFKNSYASENILRESSTSQSLKKIEEKEEEKQIAQRKLKNMKVSQKILDNFLKSKTFGGV